MVDENLLLIEWVRKPFQSDCGAVTENKYLGSTYIGDPNLVPIVFTSSLGIFIFQASNPLVLIYLDLK